MKKIIALVLCLAALSLIICSCGKSDGASSDTASEKSESSESKDRKKTDLKLDDLLFSRDESTSEDQFIKLFGEPDEKNNTGWYIENTDGITLYGENIKSIRFASGSNFLISLESAKGLKKIASSVKGIDGITVVNETDLGGHYRYKGANISIAGDEESDVYSFIIYFSK